MFDHKKNFQKINRKSTWRLLSAIFATIFTIGALVTAIIEGNDTVFFISFISAIIFLIISIILTNSIGRDIEKGLSNLRK